MTSKPKPSKESQPADDQSQAAIEHAPAGETIDRVALAIAEGRAAVTAGNTKIDAAMVIFRLIHDQPQQVILKAFVDGATLTEKGALTYWYNCRRKLARERR
jgi:hypothetical protein